MVAEFNVVHDDSVEIPAEVYESDGKLKMTIYDRDGGIAWEYDVSDFLQALGKAIAVIGM
jgi:hypothetical protein